MCVKEGMSGQTGGTQRYLPAVRASTKLNKLKETRLEMGSECWQPEQDAVNTREKSCVAVCAQ